MTQNKINKPLLPMLMLMGLTACAGLPQKPVDEEDGSVDLTKHVEDSAPYEPVGGYSNDVISYTIESGDGLMRIAEEFTGTSGNWQSIADHNNITDPRNIQIGQVIEIPTSLISGYQSPDALMATAPQTAVLAARVSKPTAVRPVVVTPVYANRDFDLNPIDPDAPRTQTQSGTGTQVRVIGTYYPKGVYTEPATYSTLIMRVAPGTVFTLDSEINDWYKIETEAGSGYIRSNDAAIVE